MLIVMDCEATQGQIQAVVEKIESLGLRAQPIPGGMRTSICVLYNHGAVDPTPFLGMEGVMETIPVSKPYKLVSRETHHADTLVRVGDVTIGGAEPVVIAGPCAVESYEQLSATAQAVKAAGAKLLRGGAFKPRTSPYAFQGLGEEGLKLMTRVREETGLPIVVEATDHDVLDVVAEHADVIQIGARNMQNFTLLRRAGEQEKPVLLKRGTSASCEEWLMAAEYIMAGGNRQVILCERGVRTFSNHLRNTLDLSVVPYVRKITHLPVLVDPSHATGNREIVTPMALAGIAAGAQGLIVEVHVKPTCALCDGAQSLYPEQFATMMHKVHAVASALHD